MASAFDAAASTYDAAFTNRLLGQWLRAAIRNHIPFQPGDHILELGCGTGADALWLAEQGITVTATDASQAMLAEASHKITAAGLSHQVTFKQWDINHPDAGAHIVPTANAAPSHQFDGIFANFGVLNCVANRPALAHFLSDRVRVGGKMLLVVMSPLCPWEISWHLLHGQIRTSFRRLQSGQPAHAGGGQMLPVWYPRPGKLIREFAPFFQHTQTIGIGIFLPPSYLDHLVDRWPGIFARLAGFERHFGRYFPFTHLNDHYLILFERR